MYSKVKMYEKTTNAIIWGKFKVVLVVSTP